MPIRPEMKSRYPADWKLRSRFVREYRARNKCERCGAENGKPHPLTGSLVVLTCAHIYDDRPEAASLLNLQALCQKCHNGLDGKARAAGIRERRDAASGQLYLFAWGNNEKRASMKGRACRVVCRGTMNSAMVDFADNGQREVISRNALRKANVTPDRTATR